MSHRVLALDLSDTTGWAVMESPWRLVECGRLVVKPGRFDSYDSRFARLEKGLSELIATLKPTVLAYEVWRKHNGVQAAQVLGGLLAVALRVGDAQGIKIRIGLEVPEIKKHATANRMAPKLLMMEAASRLWPLADIVDENVADALHIARLALTKV